MHWSGINPVFKSKENYAPPLPRIPLVLLKASGLKRAVKLCIFGFLVFDGKSHCASNYDSRSSQTSWWFQPLWKIWSSNWIMSPTRDENQKYLKPPPRLWFEIISNYSEHPNSLGMICHSKNPVESAFLKRMIRWWYGPSLVPGSPKNLFRLRNLASQLKLFVSCMGIQIT